MGEQTLLCLISVRRLEPAGYQLSEKASGRVNHVNVYDKLDPVQSNGGDSFMNKLLGVYSKGARTGKRIG